MENLEKGKDFVLRPGQKPGSEPGSLLGKFPVCKSVPFLMGVSIVALVTVGIYVSNQNSPKQSNQTAINTADKTNSSYIPFILRNRQNASSLEMLKETNKGAFGKSKVLSSVNENKKDKSRDLEEKTNFRKEHFQGGNAGPVHGVSNRISGNSHGISRKAKDNLINVTGKSTAFSGSGSKFSLTGGSGNKSGQGKFSPKAGSGRIRQSLGFEGVSNNRDSSVWHMGSNGTENSLKETSSGAPDSDIEPRGPESDPEVLSARGTSSLSYKKNSTPALSPQNPADNSDSEVRLSPDKVKYIPPTYMDKSHNGTYYRNFYLGYDGYIYLKIPIYKTKQLILIGLSDLWDSADAEIIVKKNKVPTQKELKAARAKWSNIGTTLLVDENTWYTTTGSVNMNIPGRTRTDKGYGLHPLYVINGIKYYYLDSPLFKPGDVLYILAHSLMGEGCSVSPGSAGACYALYIYYLAYLCEDSQCLSLSVDSDPKPGN